MASLKAMPTASCRLPQERKHSSSSKPRPTCLSYNLCALSDQREDNSHIGYNKTSKPSPRGAHHIIKSITWNKLRLQRTYRRTGRKRQQIMARLTSTLPSSPKRLKSDRQKKKRQYEQNLRSNQVVREYKDKEYKVTSRPNVLVRSCIHHHILDLTYPSSNKTQLSRKHQRFDSTKGFPGEGPDIRLLSVNLQGAHTQPDKYLQLMNYAMHRDNRYDIVCIQETHSDIISRIRSILALNYPNVKSWEAINTDKARKGGVAIIVLNNKINPRFVMSDNTTPTDWTQDVTQQEKDAIELDSIKGKWITITLPTYMLPP